MNTPSESRCRSLHSIAVLSLAAAFLASLAGVTAISARAAQSVVPVQARAAAAEHPVPISSAAARHLPWSAGANYSGSVAFGLN